ncbi:uncharacterized protein LOC144878275 [Branchiostoma floridae x Branchiostoma japonicum]
MGDMYECPQPVRVAVQVPPRAAPPVSRYGPTTAAPKRDAKLPAPRTDPTSSDDYECPAAVVIRPQPVRTAPMVSSSPRPIHRANNYPAGAPKRTNSSGEKTSYRASFLIFTLLMVLSVSLQVSAFILSMSAGNDAEELREQQKKFQLKTEGRFKALEAQLAKQKAALSQVQKHAGPTEKPEGEEMTTATALEDAAMNVEKIPTAKQLKRLTRATPDAKAAPLPLHATTPEPEAQAPFGGIQLDYMMDSFAKEDCADWYMAGVVEDGPRFIRPRGTRTNQEVYCHMDQEGGWTVIHARKGFNPGLYREPWYIFKKGFKREGWESFWLGNDLIHNITRQTTYQLKVIGTKDGTNPTVAARHTMFRVGNEEEGYRLSLGDFMEGDAGNILEMYDGQPFVTADRRMEPDVPGWWASIHAPVQWHRSYAPRMPFVDMVDLKMMIKPA